MYSFEFRDKDFGKVLYEKKFSNSMERIKIIKHNP
jgi:hypothetical protein